MDALDAIFGRRSIRRYTEEPISDEHIRTLLRAGMAAPSARDRRDWHFMVLRDRKNLDAIVEIKGATGSMLKKAPMAIVVCGDLNLALPEWPDYWVQDCSAAMENMLIAAVGLGLGGVWLGFYPNPERVDALKKALNMPDHLIPLGVMSVGHPAVEKEPIDRYEEEKVWFDM